VNNFFKILIIFICVTNCSLDTKSGIWTDKKKVFEEIKNIKKLFVEDEPLEKEFNPDLKIKLNSKLTDNSSLNNLTNNNGRINYNGELKNTSIFKFSKIENFQYYEPELIFDKDNLIFFNKKGSIIKFDANSKIIWKKNFYNKQEKKLKPVLNFAKNSDTLIVADNIAKYYAVDLNSGKLIWSKSNSSPLNSQIKIYKEQFFLIDFDNTLKSFSIKSGNELWRVKGTETFIKSEKKLSLVIVNNVLYFSNSIGDITAVNIKNGSILWQTPTQSSTVYLDSFLLKTSNIVANEEMIVFSNNKNELYSIDLITGSLRWKQKINSSTQSSIINDLIFSVTNEGYLTIIDSKTGNLIRSTDIFNTIDTKKRAKINPVGFIIGRKNIYLTTDHGRLLIIDIELGKTKSILKIDSGKISSPFILNKNLFIVKADSIIKLD
tara:strand:+ start:110 stop:1411 length:1302 start_codon:yes stop_codon:yes gene_type:complete